MARFKDRDVVLVRVANDRHAFKVANNTTTTSSRKKYSRIISGRASDSFLANRRRMWRNNGNRTQASGMGGGGGGRDFTNVIHRAWRCEFANKYSMATGRTENTVAMIYQYKCNLERETTTQRAIFRVDCFYFLFLRSSPPSLSPSRPPVRPFAVAFRWEATGRRVWTTRMVSQALKVTM